MGQKLPESFYRRDDVVAVSRDLLGKQLCVYSEAGNLLSGKIVETEAYDGRNDRANHAHRGRRTNRTKIMFEPGGVAYVYLCYGIHHLFNVITNTEGIPDAVLVRAIEPEQGLDQMLANRNMDQIDKRLTNGPGKLSQALGITVEDYGRPVTKDRIWIEDRGITLSEEEIVASERIGIDYAGEDAQLPYRFTIRGNRFVSKRP